MRLPAEESFSAALRGWARSVLFIVGVGALGLFVRWVAFEPLLLWAVVVMAAVVTLCIVVLRWWAQATVRVMGWLAKRLGA